MKPSIRSLSVVAAALVLAMACAAASAADTDSRQKKHALIRLLVKAGKNEEAAVAMRSLYPKGPPYGGELAIEYFDVVGNTDAGWEEATAGLEKLAKASPDDLGYQVMLGKQLTRRPATLNRGLQLFAKLAVKPGVDKQRVLSEWRTVLGKLETSEPSSIPAYKDYLEVDPDNSAMRDALADAQRAEAKRLPWQMRDKADAQLAAGHPEEAMNTLKRALLLDPKNAWVRFDLSRLYHKRGEVRTGRDLMEAGLTVAPDDADMLYANALYLGLLDEAGNALRLLNRIPPGERTVSMKRLMKKMDIQQQTQQAQALAHEGKTAEMHSAMRHAEGDAKKDAELSSIVANAWIDLNEPARGVALMRPFAAHANAQADALIYYAKVLNRAEQYDELEKVLKRIAGAKKLTASDRDDLRYLRSSLASHRADTLRQRGRTEEARAVLVAALKDDPDDVDMQMAMARVHVAAGARAQARDIYLGILKREPGHAGAQRALDRMAAEESSENTSHNADTGIAAASERQLVQAFTVGSDGHVAQGYATAGVDFLSKLNGTSGISDLTVMELPMEARIPVGESGGRIFAQVAPVYADAGTLQPGDLYNLRQYGKVLALSPGGIANAPGQSARGNSIALGYDEDGLRADIGLTPFGFPVSNVVGGVKWSHYTADSGFSLDLSRRPVTSSLLSYAGVTDPVSGEVWGGVVTTGAGLHLSHDLGRLTGFIDPGYYRLTGKNVLDNTELALRTGFNWSFIDREDMRLTAGMAITYWNYRENLRFYSFGHGGYYSPQKYYSLALPFRWTGREENWSYMLQGSVSASVSQEKTMLFYPTSASLQAQGMANSATMVPIYAGGPGHGTGFSFGGAVEYRLTSRLYGGALGQIDRSAYYTPNYAIFYLRYMLDSQTGAVPFPPDPVKAYSRF
ncbi:MAG TPA: cellulose synthase subunit BcsC-related outer membrane protein [Gallionellaceae bacterium]